MKEILSQEEIDALLDGVDDKEHSIRGQMPMLEMINERFARYLRISLFKMLRRSTEVTVEAIQKLKFGEYIHSLSVPTSLNLIQMNPLKGTAMLVIEPELVFLLVDNFFGGEGKLHRKKEGYEFTPAELRLTQMFMEICFADLVEAWEPVMAMSFEFSRREDNPLLVNMVAPDEEVVVNSLHIELEGGGGDIHLSIPYFMLEPSISKQEVHQS